MLLTVFQIFGVPVQGTGDLTVDDVYRINDSDKENESQTEKELKKSILTDIKAKQMSDKITHELVNLNIRDRIEKKIFRFKKWF